MCARVHVCVCISLSFSLSFCLSLSLSLSVSVSVSELLSLSLPLSFSPYLYIPPLFFARAHVLSLSLSLFQYVHAKVVGVQAWRGAELEAALHGATHILTPLCRHVCVYMPVSHCVLCVCYMYGVATIAGSMNRQVSFSKGLLKISGTLVPKGSAILSSLQIVATPYLLTYIYIYQNALGNNEHSLLQIS